MRSSKATILSTAIDFPGTGWGEAIMRVVLAKSTVDQLAGKDAAQAAKWAVATLHDRVDGLGGVIVVDREGRIGFAYNTPRMAYAYVREGLAAPQFGI